MPLRFVRREPLFHRERWGRIGRLRLLGISLAICVVFAWIQTVPAQGQPSAQPAPRAGFLTLTPPPSSGVVVEAITNDTNVRYAPGLQAPRIGRMQAGERFDATRRHATLPWVEVVFPAAPGGRGWVALEVVTLSGDVNVLPVVTSRDEFGYPTLTPAAPAVSVVAAPNGTILPLPPAFAALGTQIIEVLHSFQFNLNTGKQAGVFVLNLSTNQNFVVNAGVAFSGASMLKIPVMVTLYSQLSSPPNRATASLIARMMVCSNNPATDEVLRIIGSGDLLQGALETTATIQALGLRDTFLARGFMDTIAEAATSTPLPPDYRLPVVTTADQTLTQPDPENQLTPSDMGFLLAGIYQCAQSGAGPLMTTFRGSITQAECQHMLWIMAQPKGKVLIDGGLPDDPTVVAARKTGFVREVHGDAGIVLSPGGDYVIVAVLRQPGYLSFNTTFPVIAEISRLTFNTFNPARALDAITSKDKIPACSVTREMLNALTAAVPPALR